MIKVLDCNLKGTSDCSFAPKIIHIPNSKMAVKFE